MPYPEKNNADTGRVSPAIEPCPKRIFLNTLTRIIVLNLNEIAWLKSSSNYTLIKMADGSRHTSSKHLKTYSETLETNPDFLRIHRSSIVNKNFVKAIFRKSHTTILIMKDEEQLAVSSQKKEFILTELSK